MSAVRQAISNLKLQGWNDEAILSELANRPSDAVLAELKTVTSATEANRSAMAMTNAIQHEIDAINQEET